MADPFSIAAGAVAISETGIRLANTIYDACKAEKQLEPLADHVRSTSTVLKHIESHLRDESSTKHFKAELYDETERVLERCTKAFADLDEYIASLFKHDGRGGRKLSAAVRLTWNWRRKDIAAREIHLERSHAALNRLLTVMIFVSSTRYVFSSPIHLYQC